MGSGILLRWDLDFGSTECVCEAAAPAEVELSSTSKDIARQSRNLHLVVLEHSVVFFCGRVVDGACPT